jgi:hypothetical protein
MKNSVGSAYADFFLFSCGIQGINDIHRLVDIVFHPGYLKHGSEKF